MAHRVFMHPLAVGLISFRMVIVIERGIARDEDALEWIPLLARTAARIFGGDRRAAAP